MPQPTLHKELLFEDPYSRLLNKRELSRYLCKSESNIDFLRKAKIIPSLIIGGSVRFSLSEVEAAIRLYQTRISRRNLGPPSREKKNRQLKRQAQGQGQEAVA